MFSNVLTIVIAVFSDPMTDDPSLKSSTMFGVPHPNDIRQLAQCHGHGRSRGRSDVAVRWAMRAYASNVIHIKHVSVSVRFVPEITVVHACYFSSL